MPEHIKRRTTNAAASGGNPTHHPGEQDGAAMHAVLHCDRYSWLATAATDPTVDGPAVMGGTIDHPAFGVVCCGVMATRPTKLSGATDRLSIRLDLASGAQIGPGKIAVLEAIALAGSISAAGRALKMSYRRTWELVEDLNKSLGTAVVETAAGGSGGGGAALTKVGKAVVTTYRAIEMDTALAARKHLLALNRVVPGKPR
jgi:molybdate transport system regulatory protein